MRKYVLIIVLSSVFSTFAQAGEDDVLAQVMYELTVIEKLSEKAKKNDKRNSKYIFCWDILLDDISMIKKGINSWNNKEQVEPREIEQIEGDYIKKGSQ